MTSLLSLEYPNGRTYEFESIEEMNHGEEFELYGHRWKVVGSVPRPGRRHGQLKQMRLLCRQCPKDVSS